MNGTVKIGRYTVVRDGKRTTITGAGTGTLRREQFRQLKAQANAMLAGRAAAGLPASDDVQRDSIAPAHAYEPPTPLPAASWHDTSSGDRWGARPNRQVVPRTWNGGNCLRACVASILGAAINKVPDPSREFSTNPDEGWVMRYGERLGRMTGYRLEHLPVSLCPPKNPNALWIATIDERPGPADHCVVARGYFVVHDPSDMYSGSLPLERLVDGMLVVPTKRVVPVLSPQGSRRAVVAT
jgi:hypothetical protein